MEWMRLHDIVTEDAVCTRLGSCERDEAIRELLAQLAAAGALRAGQLDAVYRVIIEREALGSTAIGRGCAVPHARTDAVERAVAAVGLSAEGVEFNALDGERVHAIFLVVGPSKAAGEYLEIMEQVSRLIQNEDFRRFLRRAATGAEVRALIQEMSG
jgi:PTS system fructose-specific IIA component/PTS system nitrogen regulatory IIA component